MRRLALLVLTGCSFLAVDRTGAGGPHPRPCTSSYVPVAIDVVAVAISGLAVVAASSCHNEQCIPGAVVEGYGGIAAGLVSVVSALYGTYYVGECRDASRAAEPPPAPAPAPAIPPLLEPIAARDVRARDLTLQAHNLAAAKHCVGIADLGARVRELDLDYYTLVFSVDASIRACLAR